MLNSTFRTAAIATLLSTAAFAAPAFAQSDAAPAPNAPAAMDNGNTGADSAAAPAAAQESKRDAKMDAHTDKHIKELRSKLMITPAQDSQWQQVEQVMRDNDTAMKAALDAYDQAKSGSAVDVLKARQQLDQAHLDAMGKFIPAFQSLYDALTPAQKANADALFQEKMMKHDYHKAGASGMSQKPAGSNQ